MSYKIPVYKCRLVRDGAVTVKHLIADSAEASAEILSECLRGLPHEEMRVLLLNGKAEVIGVVTVAQGGSHSCAVSAADIFRPAIVSGAGAIIVGHNHPSGDPTPSDDDVEMTAHLVRFGSELGVAVLDHIICCPEKGSWRSIKFPII